MSEPEKQTRVRALRITSRIFGLPGANLGPKLRVGTPGNDPNVMDEIYHNNHVVTCKRGTLEVQIPMHCVQELIIWGAEDEAEYQKQVAMTQPPEDRKQAKPAAKPQAKR